MRIPRELEKFMAYGFLQCADSFLFMYTFLPIRYITALWGFITRPLLRLVGLRRRGTRLLSPAEVCDLLKGTIWIVVSIAMLRLFDTNMLYHLIKSQSIIKLYIFYNMLEVRRFLKRFEVEVFKLYKNFRLVIDYYQLLDKIQSMRYFGPPQSQKIDDQST